MYKVAWIARFHPDLTTEEGHRHWAEVHGPLCAKVPGIERYVQSHVVGGLPLISGVAQEEPQFDGYSCAWWADRAAFEASMQTPEWATLHEDGHGLWDEGFLWNMSANVEEITQIEGDSTPYKAVWVCRFKPGMTRAEGRDHWTTTHGPIFHGVDINRYVQNQVVGAIAADGEADTQPGFDGFSECWFDDEAQLGRAVTSDGWAAANLDGPNFLDVSLLWGAILEEKVMKEAAIAV
jgi:uncharacterized protein (TIGR02118 family)